jgi:serine/threonine protein kinase
VPGKHTGYVPEATNHGLVIDEFYLFSSSLLVSFYVQVLLKSNMQTTKLDIWSAGVSLLQLVAGKAPFPSSSSEQ